MIAAELVQSRICTVRAACEAVSLRPSSYYYQPHRLEAESLSAALEQEAGRHPTYGSRRLTHQLRRAPYGYPVNRKHIQRLMRQNGLLRPVKRTVCHTTDSHHPYPRYPNLVEGLKIERPEQVWVHGRV